MSTVSDSPELPASFQTRFFSNAIRRSDVQNGVCEIDGDAISLRAGSQAVEIPLETVQDLTVGTPPEKFNNEIEEVFGIKFTANQTPRVCFIEYDPEQEVIFQQQLFAEIINGKRAVVEYGAQKGGQQTGTDADQVRLGIKPDSVVFRAKDQSPKSIALGEIVNIQSGKRTVGGRKRDVIKVDHMKSQTRFTSYLGFIDTRIQNLFNRYLRTEYSNLQSDIEETEVSETIIQLIVGYYTTQNIEQTMRALTGGNKDEFESLYEEAMEHGLVTHPDDGVGLTQKGKMLANTELNTVNV